MNCLCVSKVGGSVVHFTVIYRALHKWHYSLDCILSVHVLLCYAFGDYFVPVDAQSDCTGGLVTEKKCFE